MIPFLTRTTIRQKVVFRQAALTPIRNPRGAAFAHLPFIEQIVAVITSEVSGGQFRVLSCCRFIAAKEMNAFPILGR